MPCFYVVFTRYQLKLALAHRSQYGGHARAVLAFHRRVGSTDEWKVEFSRRLVFDATTGIRGPANRPCFRMLCDELEKFLVSIPVDQRVVLLVASAAYPISNWLLVRYRDRVDTAALADGLSAYLPLRTTWVDRALASLRTAFACFSYGIRGATFLGHPHGLDSPLIDAIFAEWPHIMPAHGKTVHPLPPSFRRPEGLAVSRPRASVWFLGQPHLVGIINLREHLTKLIRALRADHPQATRFIYKRHHFEPASIKIVLEDIGFEVDLSTECAEELLCADVPIAVYSYRSTALLTLRPLLPPEVLVISFAPWLVRPPGESSRHGSIESWIRLLGIGRPMASSQMRELERGLGAARYFTTAPQP